MALKKQVSDDGNVLTITISGRFDISAYKDFGQAYADEVDSASKFVIDMAECEYLDSSALGMLLMLRERTGSETDKIDIINLSPAIKNIFTMANFDKLFNIE